jgi:hypothetical protein
MQLEEKYGISTGALVAYAEKIEQLVRPEITSHVLAGVLGCLPRSYQRQLVAGGEVLLISRILKALNTEETGLAVAEMAKLASILTALAGASRGESGKPAGLANLKKRIAGKPEEMEAQSLHADVVPIKLAESVRLLYGINWPPEKAAPRRQCGAANTEETDGNPGTHRIGLSGEGAAHVHLEECTP